MKALCVTEAKKLEFLDREKPELKSKNDVLVKIKAVGICGSDVHIYHGTNPLATYPRVIGHEFSGEVVGIGDSVTKVKIGDRVAIDPVTSCGECYACRTGNTNVCQSLEVSGVHTDGGMQEYIVVKENRAFKFDPEISWEEGALIEPFTIAAQSTSKGDIREGDTVFIMGAGPIGLGILQVAKLKGARCMISDFNEYRLEIAKSLGADYVFSPAKEDVFKAVENFTGGEGANVVIDAVCIPQTFEQAVLVASPAGRVVLLGFHAEPSKIAQLNITKKGLEIKGSRLHANKFPEVIEWFEKNKVDAGKLISHRFKIEDIQGVFDLIENDPSKVCKIVVTL
ncbi:zinc-binding alcohol dehydrogenase family protein [uncultured Ilyobacter sp.]|uniref:zinc-binding alcohol dehydrogenase family protein n=1 Tax=uncultured Ilyobacter sp. TaxID=544433 RepID=UPI0029F4FFB9|nr:zinc-binding alcohol dehydrogenase family protein [uncultured Ilyobacter sp.]